MSVAGSQLNVSIEASVFSPAVPGQQALPHSVVARMKSENVCKAFHTVTGVL